jgi:aquaporin Z
VETSWERQAIAEFVATFALVFIGAGSVVMAANQQSDLVGVALAHGLVLAVMVSVIGHISGGHVNPAVTISAWVAGKIDSARAVLYIVAQLAGAIAGAGFLRWVMPEDVWRVGQLGTPLLAGFLSTGQAVLLEAVLTFFLVFTVFGVAVDDRGAFGKIAGLPIGLVLTFDILVGGPLTGAAMNPARSFGPALVSGTWDDWWVYWIGPIGGGVIAGALYWFAFLRTRAPVSAPPSEVPMEVTDTE